MHNSNEVTHWYPLDEPHQPQNINPQGDTIHNTTHMVFEGELAVKLKASMWRLGLFQIETPDKTKSRGFRGFTVLDLLPTKGLVLSGLGIELAIAPHYMNPVSGMQQ